jgi:hypothetical protein
MWHLAVDMFTLETKPGWSIALNLTWAYQLVPNKMTVHHLRSPLRQTQTLTMTVDTKKTHPPGPFLALVLALLRHTSALLLLVVLEGEAIPSLIVLNSKNNKNQMTRQKDKKLNPTPRNGNWRKMMMNVFK